MIEISTVLFENLPTAFFQSTEHKSDYVNWYNETGFKSKRLHNKNTEILFGIYFFSKNLKLV